MAPELAVQKYFRERAGQDLPSVLKNLKVSYGINGKKHSNFENLIHFKYTQSVSPMHEPIVQDCRGIILDSNNDWTVVAMAFRKFFNHLETNAATIDWSTASVQDKVDGSLCVLYPYANAWHIATSGLPDAAGTVGSTTYAGYFWDTFRSSGMVLPPDSCGTCFFFELAGPMNRGVVEYDAPRLTVLGCRRLPSLEEASAQEAAALLGRPDAAVRSFPLRTMDEIQEALTRIRPDQQEGFVVVDAAWRRIKVKHPMHVATIHALSRGPVRQSAIVQVARKNEIEEVAAAMPALRPALDVAAARLDRLAAAVEEDLARLTAAGPPAVKAAVAAQTPWAKVLRGLHDGRCATAREGLGKMKLVDVLPLLGMEADAPPKDADDGCVADSGVKWEPGPPPAQPKVGAQRGRGGRSWSSGGK